MTAYALGELEASERPAVEKLLAESAEARADVEQTQALVRALAADYAHEQERYLAARKDDDGAV